MHLGAASTRIASIKVDLSVQLVGGFLVVQPATMPRALFVACGFRRQAAVAETIQA